MQVTATWENYMHNLKNLDPRLEIVIVGVLLGVIGGVALLITNNGKVFGIITGTGLTIYATYRLIRDLHATQ